MSRALPQLLALRRTREQQAAAQLQRAVARHREQEELLARMEVREKETEMAVATQIAHLYRQCVNLRLSRADLDLLMAKVDGQYALEAEMHAAVVAAGKELAAIAAEVEAARKLMLERSRNVQKLDLIVDTLRVEAERAAEVTAEAEAERPQAPPGAAFP